MNEPLRFAEAVCEGHPDRLADRIAARIVDLACGRDGHALVGVEVAIHRNVVFIDGRIAAGTGQGARSARKKSANSRGQCSATRDTAGRRPARSSLFPIASTCEWTCASVRLETTSGRSACV